MSGFDVPLFVRGRLIEGDWIDYDPEGKVLAFGDRNDNRLTLRRNLGGFVEGVIDRNGLEVIRIEPDELGRPQRVVDYSEREVRYTWNGDNLTNVLDVRGKDWAYSYQTLNDTPLLSGRTDPRGHSVAFVHEVIPPGPRCVAGSGLSWAYDEQTETWEQYVSNCTSWVYADASLLLRQINDEIGLRTRYAYFYDARRRHYIMARRDGEGTLEERRVDLDGELIEHTRNDRTLRLTAKDGRHRIHTDARGLKTRTERDQWENPTEITYPDGHRVEMAYDPNFNGLTQRIDERGILTEHQYDESGNRLLTIEAKDRPEQRTSAYTYHPNGLLASQTRKGETAADDATTRYEYDEFGNLTLVTDPEGHQRRYQDHDALGNPRTLIDERGKTWRYTYDAAGNRLTRTSPLGHAETTWDAAGNRETHTDARTQPTAYRYDARNRLTTSVHPDLSETHRSYNGRDQLLTQTDEQGHPVLSLEYDAEGNLAAVIDGAGNRIEFDHGLLEDSPYPGLLNRIDYPGRYRPGPGKVNRIGQYEVSGRDR